VSQKRYLGIDLSGAKNSKTALAVLEYFPREKKVFLLDVHLGIGADPEHDSDEVLVQTLQDHTDGVDDFKVGVNVPLTYPPCVRCPRKTCPLPKNCTVPEVKWMRNFYEKGGKGFTPYTQRPVELWLKQEVLAKIPERLRFELDETLGGNKAPLTARMIFLQHHLQDFQFVEVLPKLTVSLLIQKLKLNPRMVRVYRQLEDGAFARQTILERMTEHLDIFIYDRDVKKLTENLGAFDAFLCAYTALLSDLNACAPTPKNFAPSGFILYPNEVKAIAKLWIEDTDSET
jgi:hypothetical protein